MLDEKTIELLFKLTPDSQTYTDQLKALNDIFLFLHPSRYLEIGAFQGRSLALFSLLEAAHKPQHAYFTTSIDHWEGGDEHKGNLTNINDIEKTFDNVLQICKSNSPKGTILEKKKSDSRKALASLIDREGYYDLLLIDAGHKAKDVISDLINSWSLLRPGGIMIIDDYTWSPIHSFKGGPLLNSPKIGIDSFINCFNDEITILSNMPLLQIYLLKEPPKRSHYLALMNQNLPDSFNAILKLISTD